MLGLESRPTAEVRQHGVADRSRFIGTRFLPLS
jgi:hypothetical protein